MLKYALISSSISILCRTKYNFYRNYSSIFETVLPIFSVPLEMLCTIQLILTTSNSYGHFQYRINLGYLLIHLWYAQLYFRIRALVLFAVRTFFDIFIYRSLAEASFDLDEIWTFNQEPSDRASH